MITIQLPEMRPPTSFQPKFVDLAKLWADDDLESIAAIGEGLDPVVSPFAIVADVNEGFAYRFAGMRIGSKDKARELIVPVVVKPLYQMAKLPIVIGEQTYHRGLADYSIDGHEEEIQIERKSLEDLYATVGGRRDEFEAEVKRLDLCGFAAVMVEAQWDQVVNDPPEQSRLLPRSLEGTVIAWSLRYPRVHWFFAAGRAHAEHLTYRILEMWWRQRQHA